MVDVEEDPLAQLAFGKTLDPEDWPNVRNLSHQMLDDILDYVEHVRSRPVWQPIPDRVRVQFRADVPTKPSELADVYEEFSRSILPYTIGNVHPGFMGWVHGGGTVVGILSEMLAAGLNANLGGRDHIPIEVERQIVEWARRIFDFPEGASGLFLTGTSIANFLALIIARTAFLGTEVRQSGIAADNAHMVAYTSAAAHGCITQAFELSGLGRQALRLVEADDLGRMKIDALWTMIADDRKRGLTPFLLVGTAGTVDTGATDDLMALSQLCGEEKLWFHVDGAFGALAILAPDLAPLVRGIQQADSIAFDFHKWGQVPYDAGFLLVRDGNLHRSAFASSAAYLSRETRGLAAGSPWPCDFGPDLSRGFRALKAWFTLKTYGTEQLGAMISRTCALARYLEHRVRSEPRLELVSPAQLNIVCFRYRGANADKLNVRIVLDLQESGIAAPSMTTIRGILAIRAAIVNHRTQPRDINALIDATIAFGDAAVHGQDREHLTPP